MAKRISKILFIVLLFSIPVGELVRIPFLSKQVNLLEIISVLFIIFSLATGQINFGSKLKKPVLIFCGVLFLSLLTNFSNLRQEEFLVAFSYLARWVLFALVYFAVSSFDKVFKSKIQSLLIASGSLILLGGIGQYFLYPNLRNLYYLGWDEHLYRLFSSFLDPNFAGVFLVLFFLFLLGQAQNKPKPNILFIGGFTLLGIILTFSRSAYLMLATGSLITFYLSGKRKLAFVLIGLFVIGVLASSLIGLRSEGTNLLRITSTQARLPSAKNAIAIFQKNPILGVGFNSYEFALKKYNLEKPSKYDNHASAGTDNSFLFILATTGIVGLISYLYLWSQILSLNRKSKLWPVLISSAIALFVGSLFINSLFYSFIMIWIWILIAICED